MKKCPTCGKTFEDNLKFCQTDGTPLADDAPPPDPYQTVVIRPEDIGAPVPIEPITPSTKAENVVDVLEIPEEEEIENDPLKTMVSTGSPFEEDDDLMKTAVVSEAERKEIFGEKPETNAPPPSPFGSSAESSSVPPDIPKFNEPDLSPPSFGDVASPSLSKEEKTPPPISSPDEPPPPIFELPKTPSVPPNTPIPSPFDASMPPGYQTPSTPPFKEPEVKSNEPSTPFGGSPFNNPAPEKQQMQQQQSEFSSPVSPAMGNHPPSSSAPSAADGQNKTLAIVSLVLGILGFLCCGNILCGIPAIILGYMARNKEAENPNAYAGGTMALVGMILGGLSIISFVIVVIIQLFFGGLGFMLQGM